MEKCMGVTDEVLRKKKGELWNVLEFGGMVGKKKKKKRSWVLQMKC